MGSVSSAQENQETHRSTSLHLSNRTLTSVFETQEINRNDTEKCREKENEPDIGDEIKVPVNGITGTTLPGIFYHTGIYVGQRQVVSKYENPESTGQGYITLETLDIKWKDWQLSRKGSCIAAEKAMNFFSGYLSGCKESYHIMADNCQHFTEKCLALGIGSTVKK